MLRDSISSTIANSEADPTLTVPITSEDGARNVAVEDCETRNMPPDPVTVPVATIPQTTENSQESSGRDPTTDASGRDQQVPPTQPNVTTSAYHQNGPLVQPISHPNPAIDGLDLSLNQEVRQENPKFNTEPASESGPTGGMSSNQRPDTGNKAQKPTTIRRSNRPAANPNYDLLHLKSQVANLTAYAAKVDSQNSELRESVRLLQIIQMMSVFACK